jgi:hypothetical protein
MSAKWARGNVVYVPGDDEQRYCCITSASRPGPWHAWMRASTHIWKMNIPWLERFHAARLCDNMADAIIFKGELRPPRPYIVFDPLFDDHKAGERHDDTPCAPDGEE